MLAAALAIAALAGGPLALLYFQFRHWLLAAVVWLVPLVALISCLRVAWIRPVPLLEAAFFAMACAFVLGEAIARGICAGLKPRAAASRATRDIAAAAGPLAAAYGLALAADGAASGWWAQSGLAWAPFLLALAAVLAAGWLSTILPYTEEFVARANLAR